MVPPGVSEYDLTVLQASRRSTRRTETVVLIPLSIAFLVLGYACLVAANRSEPGWIARGLALQGALLFILAGLMAAILFLSYRPIPTLVSFGPSGLRVKTARGKQLELDWRPGVKFVLVKNSGSTERNEPRFALRVQGWRPVPLSREAYEALASIASAPDSRFVSVPLKPILGIQRLLIEVRAESPSRTGQPRM